MAANDTERKATVSSTRRHLGVGRIFEMTPAVIHVRFKKKKKTTGTQRSNPERDLVDYVSRDELFLKLRTLVFREYRYRNSYVFDCSIT